MEEEKNDFDKELESLIIKDKDFRRKKILNYYSLF